MRYLIVLFMFLSQAHASEKLTLDVEKYKLKNGLTVLLYVDKNVPLVSLQQWFRVGSRNEKPGRTGLAHFFEHMMFKGTEKFKEKQLNDAIEGNGGNLNAFTTNDYTGYHVTIPSEHLKLMLEIEADRMVNLTIDKKTVDTEREVVKEERRMRVENSVRGAMWEAMFKSTFKVNNYRWPVIGYMSDLNATSVEDFKKFYQTYYSPNNAVLVVAGDFDKDKAKRWINKYYANIKAAEVPPVSKIEEPKQRSSRNVKLKKPVQSTSIMYAFQAPKLGTKDALALDVLAEILGSGDSSRLYRQLVYKKQLATKTWAYNYSLLDSGIFLVSAEVRPKSSVKRVLSTINSQISRLQSKKVSEKELEKVLNRIQYEIVSQLKTLKGRARALASAEVEYGDYKEIFNLVEKYNKVTAADVQRVAKLYLKPNQRNLIQIVPGK